MKKLLLSIALVIVAVLVAVGVSQSTQAKEELKNDIIENIEIGNAYDGVYDNILSSLIVDDVEGLTPVVTINDYTIKSSNEDAVVNLYATTEKSDSLLVVITLQDGSKYIPLIGYWDIETILSNI